MKGEKLAKDGVPSGDSNSKATRRIDVRVLSGAVEMVFDQLGVPLRHTANKNESSFLGFVPTEDECPAAVLMASVKIPSTEAGNVVASCGLPNRYGTNQLAALLNFVDLFKGYAFSVRIEKGVFNLSLETPVGVVMADPNRELAEMVLALIGFVEELAPYLKRVIDGADVAVVFSDFEKRSSFAR